jgi:hypothetical protein
MPSGRWGDGSRDAVGDWKWLGRNELPMPLVTLSGTGPDAARFIGISAVVGMWRGEFHDENAAPKPPPARAAALSLGSGHECSYVAA